MIRVATKFDSSKIMELLINYQNSSSLSKVDGKSITCTKTAEKLLIHIFAGAGIAFVSEQNNTMTGILLGIRTPSLWNHDKLVMNEICYWVEPEYRNGTAGYRLLKAYVDYCKELQDSGNIQNFTISQMVDTNLKFNKFGFKKVEEVWSQ